MLLHVSWDKVGTIRPVWKDGHHPVLEIPAAMQKNDTDESIPLHPWFEDVLRETPEGQRSGWVFNPASLQLKLGRGENHQRPDAEWVCKVIGRIGKEAGIEVEAADEHTGRPVKYATAHDLRRSCGERLREAGVPPGHLPGDATLFVGDNPQALRLGRCSERRRGVAVSAGSKRESGGGEARRLSW